MSVPKDFPISQLRKVSLYFRQEGTTNYAGLPTVHFIHESQLDVLLKATLELHYQPGFNPYSGFKAATLWEVRVEEFPGRSDTFWWTKPGLGKDKTQVGAEVLYHQTSRRVWVHPELEAHEKEMYDQEMLEEMNG